MILITGGTGLVGSHLLYELTKTNKKIRAIHRSSSNLNKVKIIFSYYTKKSDELYNRIEWVETDLNDLPGLTMAFEGVEIVYHCAAMISFDSSDYQILRNINIEGTSNIVNLCILKNIKKLCHVSSVATLAYSDEIIDENNYWDGNKNQSLYAITKYGGEMEVWRGMQEGLNAIIVNPGFIIGPGFWNSGSGILFKKIFNGQRLCVKGSFGYVGVFDVTRAMVCLIKSNLINERFVLVNQNLTHEGVYKIIANFFGIKSAPLLAPKCLLNLASKIDWVMSKMSPRKRVLSKALCVTLLRCHNFSSEKIKTRLKKFQFSSIIDSFEHSCEVFSRDK